MPAAVAGRYVFYNGSAADSGDEAGDDAAIATDKQALLAGQTPSFANVTSYARGINGVMLDVLRLPSGINLSAADFLFSVADAASAGGSAVAPAPQAVTVRRGAGANSSDRVTLTWPDGDIKNTWLRVTTLANALTGLAAPDVFSFGNLVGDTGDSDAAPFRVNALDIAAVKRALHTDSDLTGRFDFNRDGRVNALDLAAVRGNLNRGLGAVLAPPAPSAGFTVLGVWDEGEPEVLG